MNLKSLFYRANILSAALATTLACGGAPVPEPEPQLPVWGGTVVFGSAGSDTVTDMEMLPNGDVIVLSKRYNGDLSGEQRYRATVSKFDATGAEVFISEGIGIGVEGDLHDVETDSLGNIYITGTVRISMTGFTHAGGVQDLYYAKFDANGQPLWWQQVGGDGDDRGHAIVVDSNDRVFIGGDSSSTVLEGANNLNPNGQKDIVVMEIDTEDGSVLWSSMTGTSQTDFAGDATLAISNDELIFGMYSIGLADHTIDVGLLRIDPNNNGAQLGLEHYGSNGDQWDGLMNETFQYAGVVVDDLGYRYLTLTSESPTFYGVLKPAASTAVVMKVDPQGNIVWLDRANINTGNNFGTGIALDASGNVYVSGASTQGDPAVLNMLVAKWDNDGNLLWQNSFPELNDIAILGGIALDPWGNIVVSGHTTVTLHGQDIQGGNDAFIMKLDSDGNIML